MPKLLPSEEDKKSIKRILLIQTAFIGDVILITPLIKAAKELFPNALLDIIAIPQTANILENNPNINSIIIFNKKESKLKSFLRILKKIYSNKYDIAILPHSSLTSVLLVYLGFVKIRIGFDRWIARWFLTKRIPHLQNVYKIEKNLFLLSPFSDEKFSIQTELFPSNEMKQKAENILLDFKKSNNISQEVKLVAIAPGSNWFTKRWLKEHYKTLAEELTKLGFGIIFIGSKDEIDLCEEVSPVINSINLAGKLSLLESAAVVEKCDVLICNDSGAMHIANAVKTDVIVFFGPTVKKIGYFPFRENDKVMEIDLDCRPCSSHGSNSCPLGHHNCMKLIEPSIVLNEIKLKFTVE
ncbi:MAG: lipopolysaccharide heptosyltransferase II [Ignavibacteriae bacterium]|nr:lipopolysaccharide heptosyltransferase II [Ignavibacteriota bacterium]